MKISRRWRILPIARVLPNQQGAADYTDEGEIGVLHVDTFGALWVTQGGTAPGSAGVTQANTFDIFSTPAAATQATATQASAGAGKRNVLTSLTFHTNAVAAQPQQTVVIRDGASGAGTILWSIYFGAFALGASGNHTVTFPNGIVGSLATAMTIEFTTAPAATDFNSIAGAGYIAG